MLLHCRPTIDEDKGEGGGTVGGFQKEHRWGSLVGPWTVHSRWRAVGDEWGGSLEKGPQNCLLGFQAPEGEGTTWHPRHGPGKTGRSMREAEFHAQDQHQHPNQNGLPQITGTMWRITMRWQCHANFWYFLCAQYYITTWKLSHQFQRLKKIRWSTETKITNKTERKHGEWLMTEPLESVPWILMLGLAAS